jgi:hypothetical protein
VAQYRVYPDGTFVQIKDDIPPEET